MASNPQHSPQAQSGWAIWHRNKATLVPDEVITQIRASPTMLMGCLEQELETAWKNPFPITPSSLRTGTLAMDHPAWGSTPNPWWQFLTDIPMVTMEEARELNRLRRPLVTPHLDEFGWLVQERRVIDFRGSVTTHMGNLPMLKLYQTLNQISKCDLLVCCKEEIQGILKYLVTWKPNWEASTNLLRNLGWSLVEAAMMGPNSIEFPNTNCTQMNILLWNCRGALNADFTRRIYEMAVNHYPSIMVLTETRVGGERAARIIEKLPFDGSFTTDTIGYAGGLWLLWKKEEVEVCVLSSTEQEIHASIKVLTREVSADRNQTCV